MAHDSKVVRMSGQKSMGRFSLPGALIRLRDASGQSLKAMLGAFFEQADDTLFALADRAGSNQDQAAYFDAMRQLRMRRKAMTVSILQFVSQSFNELGRFRAESGSGSLEEIGQDALSLLDHAELEQQVAIENLRTKLHNRYREPGQLLAVRVRALAPGIKLDDAQVPLSPEVICAALAEACRDLDIDIRAKLVIIKLFERLLVDKLAGLYDSANQTLIAEGVLPDMKRPPTDIPGQRGYSSGPVAGPGSGAPTSFASTGSSAAGIDGPTPTFTELSALLRQVSHPAPGGNAPSGGEVLATGDLLSRLDELQSLGGETHGYQPLSLRDQLSGILQDPTGRQASLGQVDGDVINLVAMLFDFILEDRQLHPVMKALIGRLQIPVLKVALTDRNFFNRGGHPVRKLLNEMALSAIGWQEKRTGIRDPLKQKISDVVDRVLNEFTNNVELFDELLCDFGRFVDIDRRRRELVEQRLRDAEEGKARQENASHAAENLIRREVSGRDVPTQVKAILNEPWSRYLQWVVLRTGEGSDQWRAACNATERLVWTVDPQPVSEQTRPELLRAIPGVVEELRRALREISWDPFAIDAAIRDLELAHVDVLQKLVTAPVEPAPLAPAEVTGESELVVDNQLQEQEQEQEHEQVEARWLERADQLRVGAWVELVRDESRVRCKLAAFIKATGKFIFVNRSGAKVAEHHREDLARAMRDEAIVLLDDGLIFDRALESIIDNLRHNRKD